MKGKANPFDVSLCIQTPPQRGQEKRKHSFHTLIASTLSPSVLVELSRSLKIMYLWNCRGSDIKPQLVSAKISNMRTPSTERERERERKREKSTGSLGAVLPCFCDAKLLFLFRRLVWIELCHLLQEILCRHRRREQQRV